MVLREAEMKRVRLGVKSLVCIIVLLVILSSTILAPALANELRAENEQSAAEAPHDSRLLRAIISLFTPGRGGFKDFEQALIEALLEAGFDPDEAKDAATAITRPAYEPEGVEWLFPTMHITTPESPFIYREQWQSGRISLTSAIEEFTFDEVRANVRGRGNSTWIDGPAKRPLRFRFDEARAMMGSEYEARDWILLANYFDRSLLRNYSTLDFAARLGTMSFVPSIQNLHLYVNGEYMGVYLLTDERDTGPGRLDAVRWDPDPARSGFFLELDARAPSDGVEDETYVIVSGLPYDIRYPGSSRRTPEHVAYAKSYLEAVSLAIRNGDFAEIARLIDIETFVDFYLVQELVKNVDVHFLSVFMHITGEGENRRLYMGPVWDFDVAAGNAKGQALGSGPEYLYAGVFNYWYRNLMTVPEFFEAVTARWNEVRDVEVAQTISNLRHTAVHYQQDFERNFLRHCVMGEDLWGSPPEVVEITTFIGQVEHLASWLEIRAAWLDDFFNGRLDNHDPLWALVEFHERESPLNITLNGERQTFDIQPILLQYTEMIALDELVRMLGIAADYDPVSGVVTLESGSIRITHRVGSETYDLDGMEMPLRMYSLMIQEHPFLPLGTIGRALGYSVSWNAETGSVVIRTR
jgi:hypothetical protein